MPKTFCTSRGCEIEYASVRPSFCPHCGAKMGGGASASVPSRPIYRPAPVRQPVYEEYYEEDYNIDPSEIRIGGVGSAPQPVNMASIIGTNPGKVENTGRKAMDKKTVKTFFKRMEETRPAPIEIN